MERSRRRWLLHGIFYGTEFRFSEFLLLAHRMKGIIGTENFKKQERVYLLNVKEAVTLNFQ